MAFIAADEHIILMDWPNLALTADELKALRALGIRTAYIWLDWDRVEIIPGVYDWSLYDHVASHLAQADMQLLLLCHSCAVDFFPDDWYAAAADCIWKHWTGWHRDEHYTMISPWCAAGQAAELAFLQRCVDHFAGSNVQCINGSVHGGEMILPSRQPCWYDPHAIASYRTFVGDANALPADLPTYASMAEHPATVAWLRQSLTTMLTAQQRIMAAQPWHEIWFCAPERNTLFAEAQETGPRSGNWLMPELYATLPALLGAELNILLFEVYRKRGLEGVLDPVTPYLDRVWVGSQYVQGLRRHTADAITRGLRGFLTGPVHLDSGYQHLEPWMLDDLRWSLDQWARP